MASSCCWCYSCVAFLFSAPSFLSGLIVTGEQAALVEVLISEPRAVSALLQGEVLETSWDNVPQKLNNHEEHDLEGELILLLEEDPPVGGEEVPSDQEPWIGVVPVKVEDQASISNQESFAAAVVSKMKRALVLGASALIILALNQNTVREMDLSQVLSKPVIIIQTSENVTKLIGALLRGLHATAKITKTVLQGNLGATLTLWSSCGRSMGGVYGEWQGVICTGETNSQVQKYLQQLWNTVVLVALILSTGVIVHARWQYHDDQLNDDLETDPKQDVINRLSSLKTRTYRQPKASADQNHKQNHCHTAEADNCAVCLEAFNQNQCLRVLPCLHEFHRDCVDPWLVLQHTCPLCKRNALSNLRRDS